MPRCLNDQCDGVATTGEAFCGRCWNARMPVLAELTTVKAEVERLRADVQRLREAVRLEGGGR